MTDAGLRSTEGRLQLCSADQQGVTPPGIAGHCLGKGVATYYDPHQYATGISTVVVNGDVVIDEAEHTGALPGRVLRRGAHGVG